MGEGRHGGWGSSGVVGGVKLQAAQLLLGLQAARLLLGLQAAGLWLRLQAAGLLLGLQTDLGVHAHDGHATVVRAAAAAG